MKAGNFNSQDYLNRLYEIAEQKEEQEKEEKDFAAKTSKSTGFMDGGEDIVNSDGIVIPEENKKSYEWLKKEFQKARVEVKVEMRVGDSSFKPGYDMQTDLESVKDFKPGMFGEVKTSETSKEVKSDTSKQPKDNLDPKKEKPNFGKEEGAAQKKELPKTDSSKNNIKDKAKDSEKPKEKEESKETSDKKPEVKKIDLKTKKQ